MGKIRLPDHPPPPALYRDEPDRDDAASTSSAVLLNDIEYPDDELPTYSATIADVNELADVNEQSDRNVLKSYLVPMEMPNAIISDDKTHVMTLFPYYSLDRGNLQGMIQDQMKYPPNYAVRLHGTHSETRRTRDNKTKRENITDFDVQINLTQLLICQNKKHQANPSLCFADPSLRSSDLPCRYLDVLKEGQKGFRGGIMASKLPNPSPPDPEHTQTSTLLGFWCQAYTSSSHKTRTFTIQKEVTHHNTEYLEELLRKLVLRTNYRGHLKISFPQTYSTITVYSPSTINKLRFNWYLRWFCYLTFLWIFTWPILLLLTKRFEPVRIEYPYRYYRVSYRDYREAPTAPYHAVVNGEEGVFDQPLVESEKQFYLAWEKSIERAVLSQHQGWVDGIYRTETESLGPNSSIRVPSTGNAFADGMLGGMVTVARGAQSLVGWGADS